MEECSRKVKIVCAQWENVLKNGENCLCTVENILKNGEKMFVHSGKM
jgi:hypothetical protein